MLSIQNWSGFVIDIDNHHNGEAGLGVEVGGGGGGGHSNGMDLESHALKLWITGITLAQRARLDEALNSFIDLEAIVPADAPNIIFPSLGLNLEITRFEIHFNMAWCLWFLDISDESFGELNQAMNFTRNPLHQNLYNRILQGGFHRHDLITLNPQASEGLLQQPPGFLRKARSYGQLMASRLSLSAASSLRHRNWINHNQLSHFQVGELSLQLKTNHLMGFKPDPSASVPLLAEPYGQARENNPEGLPRPLSHSTSSQSLTVPTTSSPIKASNTTASYDHYKNPLSTDTSHKSQRSSTGSTVPTMRSTTSTAPMTPESTSRSNSIEFGTVNLVNYTSNTYLPRNDRSFTPTSDIAENRDSMLPEAPSPLQSSYVDTTANSTSFDSNPANIALAHNVIAPQNQLPLVGVTVPPVPLPKRTASLSNLRSMTAPQPHLARRVGLTTIQPPHEKPVRHIVPKPSLEFHVQSSSQTRKLQSSISTSQTNLNSTTFLQQLPKSSKGTLIQEQQVSSSYNDLTYTPPSSISVTRRKRYGSQFEAHRNGWQLPMIAPDNLQGSFTNSSSSSALEEVFRQSMETRSRPETPSQAAEAARVRTGLDMERDDSNGATTSLPSRIGIATNKPGRPSVGGGDGRPWIFGGKSDKSLDFGSASKDNIFANASPVLLQKKVPGGGGSRFSEWG